MTNRTTGQKLNYFLSGSGMGIFQKFLARWIRFSKVSGVSIKSVSICSPVVSWAIASKRSFISIALSFCPIAMDMRDRRPAKRYFMCLISIFALGVLRKALAISDILPHERPYCQGFPSAHFVRP